MRAACSGGNTVPQPLVPKSLSGCELILVLALILIFLFISGHCISMLRQVTSDLNSLPSGHSARRHLYNCLILCLIVWAASIIPTSQATPIFNQPATLRPGSHNPSSSATKTKNNTSISERIFASKPSWHDPCGLKHQKDLHHSKNAPFLKAIQKPNDDDLMHGIVNMAKMALRQSRFFKEDYVSQHLDYYFHFQVCLLLQCDSP